MQTFNGAWPALLTPFTKDDTVNTQVLRDLVEFLIEKESSGFYLCGTTGEGLYMTVEERKLVAETVMSEVKGRVPVIVHVGSVTVKDAVELARHAQRIGSNGISSILPPLYQTTQSLYAYYEKIAEAVPDLPVLAYIFGGPMDAVSLMKELMKIPNLAGAKYTGPNMYEFRNIINLRDHDWTIFSGMDEQCFFATMFGSSGNIGSTLNFMPHIYLAMHECYKNGALAHGLDLQIRANEITRILISFGFPGALKKVMGMLGFDCGNPRLPNLPFPENEEKSLKSQLESAGFSNLLNLNK
jgi:N-acetylneuraminate lyase